MVISHFVYLFVSWWNILIQVFVRTCVFSFLGCIPKSGIVRLYGNFMFHFLRNSQTIFQSGRATSHPHWQEESVLWPHPGIASHILNTYLLSFDSSQLVGVKWGLIVGLVCISLITMSIFSWAYWPFVHLLWRNIYLNNQIIFCYFNFIVENLSKMGQSTFTLDWYFHDCTLNLLACWCWMFCWAFRTSAKPQSFYFFFYFPERLCWELPVDRVWANGT